MAVDLLDVVSSNLVLIGTGLLNHENEIERFKTAFDLDMRLEIGVVANAVTGTTEQSRTFTLNRERISLNLSSSRSTITREYPTRSEFTRFAEVVTLAIDCSEVDRRSPRTFGYNIEMVFGQDTGLPAVRYIGERLIGPDHLGESGWELTGGAGRVSFNSAGGRRNFVVEPRFGDEETSRLFLSVNLHQQETNLPEQDEITKTLESLWSEAIAFVERLDQRGRT